MLRLSYLDLEYYTHFVCSLRSVPLLCYNSCVLSTPQLLKVVSVTLWVLPEYKVQQAGRLIPYTRLNKQRKYSLACMSIFQVIACINILIRPIDQLNLPVHTERNRKCNIDKSQRWERPCGFGIKFENMMFI